MTEEEAQDRISARYGLGVLEQVRTFLGMVIVENGRQNLISASTVDTIWARHAWDSLQLLNLAGRADGLWLDIGSGGGFPGLPVALAWEGECVLIEPRRRRAEFLQGAVDRLDIGRKVRVLAGRVETIHERAAIISARAVAGIEGLLDMAHQCGGADTRWLLPRGRMAPEEINNLRRRWSFMFHVEHSDVDLGSLIAVMDGVTRQ